MTHNQKVLTDSLKSWLPLAAAIVIFSGLTYVSVQQSYRQMANDPQIQIAEDVADAISQGTPAESIVPATGNTDIKKSLSAFVLIYDDSGKQIGSSAIIDGKNPEYPKGVFDVVKQKGETRVTWQPQAGVRMATVVTRYTGKQSGYVVAGRSLKQVEERVEQLTKMVALATALSLIVTLLLVFLFKKMGHGHSNKIAEVDVVVTES